MALARNAVLTLALALAASPARAADVAPLGSRTIAPPAGRFFAAKDGKELSWEEVVRRARAAAIVYAGEKHDEPRDHALQLALLGALRSKNAAVVLGMEMFDRTQQGALDRYRNGETDEATFLAESRYHERWGFDYGLYKPLIDYSRENGVRIAALNVTQELVSKVRKVGLHGLSLEEATSLPAIDLTNAAHRRRIVAAIAKHHPGSGSAEAKTILERYYEAMCVWDETMADAVLGELLRDRSPGLQVLVLAGRAHVETGDGIPGRVRRRFPQASLIVVTAEDGEEPGAPVAFEDRPMADVVFFPEVKATRRRYF
jgi:uncharacterized iron-regulated protein